jgi:hypothetical protein
MIVDQRTEAKPNIEWTVKGVLDYLVDIFKELYCCVI